MVEIKHIGDKYFVEFLGNGLKFRKFAGHSREDALSLKGKIEESLAGEQGIYKERFVEFSAFKNEYLENCRGSVSANSFARIQNAINDFDRFLSASKPVHFIQDLTPGIIDAYKSDTVTISKSSARRFNFNLFAVSLMCEFGVFKGHLNDNPTLHVEYLNRGLGFLGRDLGCEPEKLGLIWDGIKRGGDAGRMLSIEVINSFLNKNSEFKGMNPVRVRNLLIIRFLGDGMPVKKLQPHVNFTDVARWPVFLRHAQRALT